MSTTITPCADGGYEVKYHRQDGTAVTLCVATTEDRALNWLETWYSNVKLGRSQLASFKIANQLWGNAVVLEERK